jgi:hypothetical protein
VTAPAIADQVLELLGDLEYPYLDGVVPSGMAQPDIYGLVFFPPPLRSSDRKGGRQLNRDVEFRIEYVGESYAQARWALQVAEDRLLGARIVLDGARCSPIRQEWASDVLEPETGTSSPAYRLLGVYRFTITPA